MTRVSSFVPTGIEWLLILLVMVTLWQIAQNLWTNWGASSFWLSSLVAGIVGILFWWILGAVALLSAPRNTAQGQPAPSIHQSIGSVSNSTVNQAGGNITINEGVSEDTIKQLINQRDASAYTQLGARYDGGFIMLGVADGKIVYSSDHAPKSLKVDWTTAKIEFASDRRKITVRIPDITYGSGGIMNCTVEVPNHPGSSIRLARVNQYQLRFEVLDSENGIFVLGVKL